MSYPERDSQVARVSFLWVFSKCHCIIMACVASAGCQWPQLEAQPLTFDQGLGVPVTGPVSGRIVKFTQ